MSDLGKEIRRMVIDRKTYIVQDLPVVGGQAPQPRLAARRPCGWRQTNLFFTMSMNATPALSSAAKPDRGLTGGTRMCMRRLVEPDGIEPTTSSLQS